MTTPAMRTSDEWADAFRRFDGASHMHRAILAAQVQSDAIAFTEARVRAQVVEECAAAIDPDNAGGKGGSHDLLRSRLAARIRALAAKPVEKQK